MAEFLRDGCMLWIGLSGRGLVYGAQRPGMDPQHCRTKEDIRKIDTKSTSKLQF